MAIQNRYDFVILFDVENGNPNGDPDAGNMPRIDPETGCGIVTDVCIKRKIRNYVETVREGQQGYEIYIKDTVPLNVSDRRAFEYLGVDDKTVKQKKKEDPGIDAQIRDFMCQNFYDIRTFGAVMTTFVKAALNCGQVRGPVQLGFARSIEPVVQQEVTITRVAMDLDQLRGLEGNAASLYFGELDHLILQQKQDFYFHERNKRPPADHVNALLSFIYTILANHCASALETIGLDAYAGFLHRDRPGRASLALDLMEELRGIMADRFVIGLINTKRINAKNFTRRENRAVLLNDESRRDVLKAWQERKQDTITHPYLKEKMEWGLVPFVQAMLLARYLRGDLDEYPPFLWK